MSKTPMGPLSGKATPTTPHYIAPKIDWGDRPSRVTNSSQTATYVTPKVPMRAGSDDHRKHLSRGVG